eukprot:6215536-Karenia_brevis.AAC.1
MSHDDDADDDPLTMVWSFDAGGGNQINRVGPQACHDHHGDMLSLTGASNWALALALLIVSSSHRLLISSFHRLIVTVIIIVTVTVIIIVIPMVIIVAI